MKKGRSLIALISLLPWGFLPVQALWNLNPAPVVSPNQLFSLQRSKDANTIIYEANVNAGQHLDPSKPVAVYWIRYAERGQRENLTQVQWQMAYGYRHKPSSESGAYDICLNAFPQRPLRIAYHNGKPVALLLINGKRACLQSVFVQVDSKAHLIPRVKFIELHGTDVLTNKSVHERISLN